MRAQAPHVVVAPARARRPHRAEREGVVALSGGDGDRRLPDQPRPGAATQGDAPEPDPGQAEGLDHVVGIGVVLGVGCAATQRDDPIDLAEVETGIRDGVPACAHGQRRHGDVRVPHAPGVRQTDDGGLISNRVASACGHVGIRLSGER